MPGKLLNHKTVLLQELSLTGYDVNTGEELTELGHKIHYAGHNGLPVEVSGY